LLAGQLALTDAALFSGAALYINFVEQPARLGLDDRSLLKQWKPAYKRGFRMQAPLALAGGVLGLIAAYQMHDWRWALGAVALLCNWPFTLFAIMPTNHRLEATEPRDANAETRALIKKWGGLHAVRSNLGALSTLAFLWASTR
jgi:Domain of unknown function (DUF1772)